MVTAMHDQQALFYFYCGMMAAAQLGGMPYTCTRAQGNMVRNLAIREGMIDPPVKAKREHPTITDARKFGTYKESR